MLEHLRHQRESEDLQRKLIVADAPLEMMQQLFGLSSREYTRWRRLLTLAPSVGRPPELNEADTHALWYAWQELRDKARAKARCRQRIISNFTADTALGCARSGYWCSGGKPMAKPK